MRTYLLVVICLLVVVVLVMGVRDHHRGGNRHRGRNHRPLALRQRQHDAHLQKALRRNHHKRRKDSSDSSEEQGHVISLKSQKPLRDDSNEHQLQRKKGHRVFSQLFPDFSFGLADPFSKSDKGVVGFHFNTKDFLEKLGISFPQFTFDVEKPWYEGPNVCVTEQEENDTAPEQEVADRSEIIFHHVFTSTYCDDTDSSYKCVTRTQIGDQTKSKTKIYECCRGFDREEKTGACTKRVPLKDLLTTLKDAGATEMAKAIQSLGIDQLLATEKFTIFAPVDEAFKKYKPNQQGFQEDVVMITKDTNEVLNKLEGLVNSHIVTGLRKTGSFVDNELLNTTQPHSRIRINLYDRSPKMTANCVKLGATNKLATNGVVHMVDKVLEPVQHTILDIISKNPEFKILKTVLSKTGLSSILREDGKYTLFAPTDTAFRKLNRLYQDKLFSGSACAESIVKTHLLENVICSSVIQGRAKSRNVLNTYVNLTRDENNKLFFNDVQITGTDIMGTNGVIHIIDEVFIPKQAMPLLDVAEELGASQFLTLVEQAGMSKYLQDLVNFTLFLPTNEAILDLPRSILDDLAEDPDALANLLKYHVTATTLPTVRHLQNRPILESVDQDKSKIKIHEYSTERFPFYNDMTVTAQCQSLRTVSYETCGGAVHIIDKVLQKPKGDLFDTLSMDKEFGTFVKMAKISGVAQMLQSENDYTIFAPTNKAFESIDKERFDSLLDDASALKKLVNKHIIKGTVCCSGVPDMLAWHHRHRLTLADTRIPLYKSDNGRVHVGHGKVTQCDIVATNGVVHAVSKVLEKGHKTKSRPFTPFHWDIDWDKELNLDWNWDV